jgi:hypothetical protein
MIEAVFSRGDASLAALAVRAWQLGARYDAWSEQFDLTIWEQAAAELGMDLQALAARNFGTDEPLPWDFITRGVSRAFLVGEYERALAASSPQTTPDCTFDACGNCGVCGGAVQTVLAGRRG